MLKPSLSLILASTVLVSLGACSTPAKKVDHAHYWQRQSATSALYMRGPKAQQLLNTDIARCVAELKELYNLGAIRMAIPGENATYKEAPDNDDPAGTLADWDSPDHTGSLRAEHLDYHDFEGCMNYKGWERIKNVPYDVAVDAEKTHFKTIYGDDYNSSHTSNQERFKLKSESGDNYENLND